MIIAKDCTHSTKMGLVSLGLASVLGMTANPGYAQERDLGAPAGAIADAAAPASAAKGTVNNDAAGSGGGTVKGVKKAAADIGTIVVTGSRIPRADREGATGVTVVTGKDLEAKGYRNVFDAISEQTQNTGFTQGADYGNTFTPAANTISLRGLGPNHTLILIDGRRVADYPVAYDGNVNFVNLANIPTALVDRIEILNGSGSAIYGSDAIAGVVNVIMKKHMNGVDVNVKGGVTERGGGANGRLQITGGKEFGDLSAIFGLEVSKTNPIWATQRDFMSSTSLEGETPTSVWSRRDLGTDRQ